MTGLAGANETNSVIDRWWQIITNNNVTATADVTYRGSENTTVYTSGTFSGQEWDIPSTQWLTPSGSGPAVTVATATVAGISLSPRGIGTSTPYILSATTSPLPIELVSFRAVCENLKTHIAWTDASETNVMNIELQKSTDMNTWTTIYATSGSNSSSNTYYNYSYSETSTSIVYYRLKTNNNDGSADISALIYNQPCNLIGNTLSAFYSDNALNVFSNFANDDEVIYTLYDIQGKKVMTGQYTATKGQQLMTMPIDDLANSIYILNATSTSLFYNQKIAIAR